ncbi:Apolipoprotein O-like protein, partial [Ophiophagus hannah]
LPIYSAPPLESRYVDEKPGRLQTRISSVRKTTSYYLKNCKNPPPEFLPKVGVITVSGLTGIVLARKESEDKAETSEELIQRSEVHKDYETSMGEMKAPNVRTDVLKAPKYKADASLMDYGQASPEDADLYSKRS